MSLRRGWCILAHVVALLLATTPSWSVEEAHPVNRAEAAARFEEGTKAFEAGDFRRAADAFEAAYRLAPNTDALWNAARAWHRAGEVARAATLYSRYLRAAPPDAADRGTATTQLAALSTKLARIEVHGDGLSQLKVDDVPCDDRVVYVSRGAHVLSALVGGTPMRKDQQVEAGDVVSVVFEAAPDASATPTPLGLTPEPALAPHPEESPVAASPHKGWSPWVFAGGAVLTSVAVGLTIASGVDTENALTKFNESHTQGDLSSGQSKQLRTNVLLGTSIALGAATAAVGIWLVDWHTGTQRVQVGIEPARGAVRWTF